MRRIREWISLGKIAHVPITSHAIRKRCGRSHTFASCLTRITMTEACEAAILTHLASSPDAAIADTFPWSESESLDHLKVIGAIKSLLAEELITAEDITTTFYSLEAEADSILANGSQEIIVLKALSEVDKLSVADLQDKVGKDVAKIGMGNCMKNKWIAKDGGDLVTIKTMDEVSDETQQALQKLKDGGFTETALDDKVRAVHGARLGLVTCLFCSVKLINKCHSFCFSA